MTGKIRNNFPIRKLWEIWSQSLAMRTHIPHANRAVSGEQEEKSFSSLVQLSDIRAGCLV